LINERIVKLQTDRNIGRTVSCDGAAPFSRYRGDCVWLHLDTCDIESNGSNVANCGSNCFLQGLGIAMETDLRDSGNGRDRAIVKRSVHLIGLLVIGIGR
jgi:hypothetical protein